MIVVVLATAIIAGCASAKNATPRSTSSSGSAAASTPSPAGVNYLALVAPVNSAHRELLAQLKLVSPGSVPVSEANWEASLLQLADALRVFSSGLKNTTWPASARADATALGVAAGPAMADYLGMFNGLASTSSTDFDRYSKQEPADYTAFVLAATKLRRDLGLPPAPKESQLPVPTEPEPSPDITAPTLSLEASPWPETTAPPFSVEASPAPTSTPPVPTTAPGCTTVPSIVATPAPNFPQLSMLPPGSAAKLAVEPRVAVPAGAVPSTVQVKDLIVGSGATVPSTGSVTVNYLGVNYLNCKEFDSSWARNTESSFSVQEVIPGFAQGLAGTAGIAPMRVGGRREIVVPPSAGYGTAGSPPNITGNEELIFVVDLLAVRS